MRPRPTGMRVGVAALAWRSPSRRSLAVAARTRRRAIDLPPGRSRTRSTSGCRARRTWSARSSSSSSRRSSGSRRRSRAARSSGCSPRRSTPTAAPYAELNQLRSYIDGRGVGAVHAGVHGLRRCATTRPGSPRAARMRRSRRSRAAAWRPGALAVYPEVFGSLSVATNHLTYGITHAPGVEPGLTKLLGGGDGRELHAAGDRHDRRGRRGRAAGAAAGHEDRDRDAAGAAVSWRRRWRSRCGRCRRPRGWRGRGCSR